MTERSTGILVVLKRIGTAVADVLFPVNCLGCGIEGVWLCRRCYQSLPLLAAQECPGCRTPSPGGRTCPACRSTLPLYSLTVAVRYENDLVQALIHTLKYRYVTAVADHLATIAVCSLRQYADPPRGTTVVVPVPLHRRRLREREFNQAELIARGVARQLGWECWPHVLRRIRYTTAQATLTREQRLTNVRGAFRTSTALDLSGINVILVDDVATTCTTVSECAKVLRQVGCPSVRGLVIARGAR
ncbi:MAG: double zinc ribbon domain-containing protein [Patescibacteria group bacterium]